MKKRSILYLGLSLSILFGSFFVASATHRKEAQNVSASVGAYTTRTQSTYYTTAFTHKVTSSQYGTTLLNTLHELMYDSHESYNTYDELWTYTKESDYDIDNPDNIILLYSRQSVNGAQNANVWNREHVWCQSHAFYGTETGAGSDLHHLRPASVNYNSTRSNIPYGIVSSHTSATQMGDTDCYYTSTQFEPADYIKGDVARILMYMYTHYSTSVSGTSTKSGTLNITDIVKTNSGTQQAAWDLLMDWNESDPVDYQEMIRNNKCAYLLGNYNPFIDHPEFARMIWDDSSSQQAGLFFQTSYKTVNVGSSYTNTASAWGNVSTSDSAVYTSDNPEIASVDSSTGQVTGVSNGVVRIKARATINGVSKISYHIVVVGSGYTPKDTLNASGIVYTPTSKSSVVASHQISSETVTYKNTYQISQITSGNSATLTITNFPKTISSIILYMHSNDKQGAGSITITVGGSSYKSLSGKTFKEIYGSFTQTFVPVDVTNSSASKKTGTIVITISCSTNSLYFQKAVIDYAERTITQASSISVSPSSITMTPGEDNMLITNFSPSTTTLKTNTWSSSNSSVATVNKYGLVRAIAVGTATITATASDGSGKTGTSTVTVTNSVTPSGDPTVTGVTVTPSSTSLDVSSNPTTTLTAVVNGTNNPSQTVTWTVPTSSPSGCVTVNSSGVVTAVSAGSATVRATSVADTNYYGDCTITVTNIPKTLSSISLDTTNVQKTFTMGDTFNYTGLVVTAHFSNLTSETVTPTSVSSPNMSTTGQKTVTVSYTYGNTSQSADYQITVNESGSGEEGSYTWNLSIASYNTPTSAEQVTWNSDCATMVADKYNANTAANNYLGGDSNNRTSSRFYQNSKLTFTPQTNYEITSVVYTATTTTYANAMKNSTWTNASTAVSSTTVTITPTNGSTAFYGVIGGTTGGTSMVVNYVYTASKTLSSISLDTTNVQKAFTVGDTFNYTGLVVTAHYSDLSSKTVTPTSVSTPNMSTTGNKTVTVTYTEDETTKTESYSITVNANPSISWTAPTINVYSGSTLSGSDVNAWAVTYNDGAGHQIVLTYSQLTVKLGGTTISIPHTWSASDDGKTLTATYNSFITSASSAVQVTQSVNTITKTSEPSEVTSNLTFTAACGGSGTADHGETWTVTSDAAESNFDSTKGIHYGTGSAAVEYIQLVSDSFTTGTITQVVVNASGASGVTGSVSVTVGGNDFGEVQSFNSTASNKTFTGTASAGQIVVRIYKASAAVKAIYCKSVVVTNNVPGSSTVISNSIDHIAAQRVAVKFAKAFNAAMDTTSGCTTNLDSAWSTCSSAYDTFLSEAAALGETEEAYAKSLIANATKQYTDDSGEACIERMMKTYQVCVQKHGQTPFMSELVSLSKIAINPLQVSVKNSSNAIIIIVISSISVIAIAGYFYFRKKKDN